MKVDLRVINGRGQQVVSISLNVVTFQRVMAVIDRCNNFKILQSIVDILLACTTADILLNVDDYN